MSHWTEDIGRAVSGLLGPPFKVISEVRQARSLHPEGICLRAEVVPVTTVECFQDVAERLAGPALVRLSSATWRGGKEWPDILGAAVRLRHSPRITEEAEPGDQDLLFATLRHAWTLAPAFFTTHVHDFLENDYYGLAPFEVRGLGRVELRLTSPRPAPARQGSRVSRLKQAIQAGGGRFTFEFRSLEPGQPSSWTPVVDLVLHEEVTLDPERLRFNPFLDGLGIKPVGFLHALRRKAYEDSQEGRTEH